ncbi:MAG: hypothetical protein QW331_03505 [Candidatus Woesearchaeota archaeon]
MYEIPKNLNKYSEEFVPFVKWNLKQFIYGMSFFIIDFLFFVKVNMNNTTKLIILAIAVLLQFIFVHKNLDQYLFSYFNYFRSSRKVGYYDKKMENFIDIKEIEKNVVFLKDGTILAIIKIQPIDFSILGTNEQQELLQRYRSFLRSLDFPCQICCRSAEVSLNNWISNLEKMTRKNKNRNYSRYKAFESWINKEIADQKVKTRLFYLVIPYKPSKSKFSFSKKQNDDLKEIERMADDAIEKLEISGVKAKRMKDDELLSLFTTYFTDIGEIKMSAISPVSWLKQ